MASKNGKKKKNSMDSNRQKQKKSRNSYNNDRSSGHSGGNKSNNGPRSPPKNSTKKATYNPVTNKTTTKNSKNGSKQQPLRFDQPLKYPRKNRKNLNDKNMISMTHNGGHKNGNTNNNNKSTSSSSQRPTFQFKIGLQVGVALGDCFLQLQKLENSMDKLRNVSEDITDVMSCIEQIGGTEAIKQNSKNKTKDNDKLLNPE
eukprot:180314_1